jgi:hypothetical protein
MIWWQTLPLDFELPAGWVLQGLASYAKHMLHSVRQPKAAVYRCLQSSWWFLLINCHHTHLIRIHWKWCFSIVMLVYQRVSWRLRKDHPHPHLPSDWYDTIRVRTQCYPFRCQTYVGATTSRYNPSKICRCFGASGEFVDLGAGSVHRSHFRLGSHSKLVRVPQIATGFN